MRVISRFGLGLGFGTRAAAAQIEILTYANYGLTSLSETVTAGAQVSEDYLGVLRNAGANKLATYKGRLATTEATGAVLGPELVVNGNFSTSTGWVLGGAYSITGGKLVCTAAGVGTNGYKANIVVAGKRYKVTFTIDSITVGSFALEIGGAGSRGTVRSAPGTYTEELVAVGTYIGFYQAGASNSAVFDNVTAYEVIPTWYADDGTDPLETTSPVTVGATTLQRPSTSTYVDGVLLSPAATNLSLYSNTFSNAAWVKSNITPTKNAIGPDGAANTAWTLVAGADNATMLQSVTSASATRNMAIYLKRKTGTGAISLTVDNGTTYVEKTLTTAWVRFDMTQAAVTNPVFGVKMATNTDEIYAYQVDLVSGSVATPPIVTTTAAVTRPGTVVQLAEANRLANNGFGIRAIVTPRSIGAVQWIYSSDGTYGLGIDAAGKFFFKNNATTITGTTVLSAGTEYKVGVAMTATGATLYVNGVSEATTATGTDLNWAASEQYVGCKSGNAEFLHAVMQIETALLANVPSTWPSTMWR